MDKDVAALASAGLTAWNALVEVFKVAGRTGSLPGHGRSGVGSIKIAKGHGRARGDDLFKR